MQVLVVTISPIYWALAGESGKALNGYSLTGGRFRQESHVEFATGEQDLPPGWGLKPKPRASPSGDSGLWGGLQESYLR
jgi:hypothetical protein